RPIQENGPRIMVGGSGEKRTLRLVARYADMCNVNGGPDTVRHLLGVLDRDCADVGRDPGDITRTRLASLFLTSSPEETERTSGVLRGAAGAELGGRLRIVVPDSLTRGDGADLGVPARRGGSGVRRALQRRRAGGDRRPGRCPRRRRPRRAGPQQA